MDLFEIVGAAGLLIVAIGILLKNRQRQDILYVVGGGCLLVYSIYINNPIFIVLQLVFIFSAVYDLWIQKRRR